MGIPTLAQKRHRARKLALQALYQWQMSQDDLLEIETQFHVFNNMEKVDREYFSELLRQIPLQLDEIDAVFTQYLDRDITELNPVELAILRIASYEFTKRLDVPYKVVINEGVELAKEYGAEEGHKYVNGVLDKVAQQTRSSELQPHE